MKILTSPIVLLFVLVPFLGLSQSPRKINKSLKSDYAVQLNRYDSLIQINHSKIPDYKLLVDNYDIALTKRITQRRMIQNKKQDVVSIYKTLIQLDVAKSLKFTFQSLDSIVVPKEISKLKSLGDSKFIPRQEWTLSLDKLTIKEQNEHITTIISELQRNNLYITQANREVDQITPKLVAKQQELDEIGRTMDSLDVLLTEKLNYLFEQKELAKNNFSSKGPKGFNESYFRVFPGVFPLPNEVGIVNESSGDWEGFAMPKEPKIPNRIEDKNQPTIYAYCDEPASFNGDLKQYLAVNIVYPKRALEVGLQGKCFIQFIVSALGNISNVEVKRGVPDCSECDEEAIRVIKGMPKWNPGKNAGVAVHSTFNLPIHFKLSTE